MATLPQSIRALELIAHRFKLLSEPSRLRLLVCLREGERTVTDLAEHAGLTQANASQQLTMLADGGLILRHKEHGKTWYRLADASILDLYQLVCRSLREHDGALADSLRDTAFPS